MTPEARFWSAFYELVYRTYLLEAHSQRNASIDRLINVFLALTSTTSLGIWAVFKSYPQLWAGIIVLAQIVSAISKYLPYSDRLKSASSCAHEHREIKNWAEVKWCEIVDGTLTLKEINKARADLQTRVAKADKSHFPRAGLPRCPRLEDAATEQAGQYLLLHFGGSKA